MNPGKTLAVPNLRMPSALPVYLDEPGSWATKSRALNPRIMSDLEPLTRSVNTTVSEMLGFLTPRPLNISEAP